MEKVDILYDLFKARIPFSFIKMNDGECGAMVHIGGVISRGDDVSTEGMSRKLKECINYQAENYYVGLPCQHCRNGDYLNGLKCIEDQSNMERFLNANILINSNTWTTFQLFRDYIGDRRIVVVSNERNLSNIGKLARFNIVPYKTIMVSEKNAFENDFERIKDEYQNFGDGDIVMCLCGPLGRVLCYEWFKARPTLTCLELGSLFDPFLKNRSYAYHTLNHAPCGGCFPMKDLTDDNKKFIDSLIADPEIENECFYSWNNENIPFYSGMFYYNLDRMRSNTLIRLKKNPDDEFMQFLLTHIECTLLTDHVNKIHNITEGYCFQIEKATKLLINLCKRHNPKRIMEIGFNAGHSSLIFLANTKASVLSFDIGTHAYTDFGVDYISKKYGDRFKYIKGNSMETLGKYIKEEGGQFDIILVDGGHDYETVYRDLMNCQKLSGSDTLIILNDTIRNRMDYMMVWNNGPSDVWSEMIENGYVIEIGSEDFERGRGMSWGRFKESINLPSVDMLVYKKKTKSELYDAIENLYYSGDVDNLSIVCEFYLSLFGKRREDEVDRVKYIYGSRGNNRDRCIEVLEGLYGDEKLEEGLRRWVGYTLKRRYPRDESQIPKIIHFIYLKQRDFQKYHLRCISSASHFCPDYKIIVHNDIEPEGNVHWDRMKQLPNLEVRKTKRRRNFDDFPLRFVQYEADVIRLELLYEHGGVYLDTDIFVAKNFDAVFKTGNSVYISEETKDGGLINSFLASKPGNEFLRIWLNCFKSGLRMDNWAYHIRDSNRILLNENPHYRLKYGVEILSYINFFPFPWMDRGAFDGSRNIVLDEKTYGVHLFDTILHDALITNKFFENYYNI